MKKNTLPVIVALGLAAVSSYGLYAWSTSRSIDPNIQFDVSTGQIVKMFFILLIYFLALIVLPLFSKELIRISKLKSENWWKALLTLEFGCLLFTAICAPPDMISRTLFFIFCQPIVLVNIIAIKRSLRLG